jgi:hypothetical protein
MPNGPEYTLLRVLLMIVSSCVLLFLPPPDFEVGAKKQAQRWIVPGASRVEEWGWLIPG